MSQYKDRWLYRNLSSIGDTYSDFTIVTSTQPFRVHRIILHMRSAWFASHFTTSPKSNALAIYDHHPDAGLAMMTFFYTSSYRAPPRSTYRLRLHAEVIKLGMKYGSNDLVEAATQQIIWELQDRWRLEDLTCAMDSLIRIGIEEHLDLKDEITVALSNKFDDIRFETEFLDWGRRNEEWYKEVEIAVAVQKQRDKEKDRSIGEVY